MNGDYIMLKKIIHSCAVITIAVTVFCIATSMAHAATIDTTGTKAGDIYNFGVPKTATYGQTFSISGTDTVLNSFSLYLEKGTTRTNTTLNVRGYIASWDGSKASTILYESATQTMNAAGTLQEFKFSTGGLDLVSGNWYVAFLSTSNLGVQSTSQFGMPYSSVDAIPGQFVYMNNSTNFSQLTTQAWSTASWVGTNDAWFKADLSPDPVPEPSTMLLLGSGLVGLVGLRKKFKK